MEFFHKLIFSKSPEVLLYSKRKIKKQIELCTCRDFLVALTNLMKRTPEQVIKRVMLGKSHETKLSILKDVNGIIKPSR